MLPDLELDLGREIRELVEVAQSVISGFEIWLYIRLHLWWNRHLLDGVSCRKGCNRRQLTLQLADFTVVEEETDNQTFHARVDGITMRMLAGVVLF